MREFFAILDRNVLFGILGIWLVWNSYIIFGILKRLREMRKLGEPWT